MTIEGGVENCKGLLNCSKISRTLVHERGK